MKRVLLTGATGYLGSNLLRALLAEDRCEIIILKRSFSNTFRIDDLLGKVKSYDIDSIEIEEVFKENKIDIVLHCATDYGRKNTSILQIIEANLILPVTLLELGRNYGVSCFINTDTILDKGINQYSLSKKQFKDWLLSYTGKMLCVNVALEHFYGAGDDKTKFASFIVDAFLKKVPSIDLTKGEQKRDFIYIDDVIGAFLKIIAHTETLKNNFYEYQIGSDRPIAIKEFVLLIQHLAKNDTTKLNFGALPYRSNETMESAADLRAIRSLGWSPRYSLEDGLELMIREESKYLS